jgi:hypothetical protein
MGWNDRIGDDGYRAFLREVLDTGDLGGVAEGITRLVLDKGEHILSPKQQHALQRYVVEVHVTEECKRCGCPVPWSEMLEAHTNGGYCSWCDKMMSNDD